MGPYRSCSGHPQDPMLNTPHKARTEGPSNSSCHPFNLRHPKEKRVDSGMSIFRRWPCHTNDGVSCYGSKTVSIQQQKWDRGQKSLPFITSSSSLLFTVHFDMVDAHHRAEQPDETTQEAESLRHLPSIAVAIIGHAVSAVGHATALAMVRVGKQTECGEPGGGENQVHRPGVEKPTESEQV
jgi:hypothetical protein